MHQWFDWFDFIVDYVMGGRSDCLGIFIEILSGGLPQLCTSKRCCVPIIISIFVLCIFLHQLLYTI